jgi:acetyl-CoA acetyltransferase
VDNGAFDGEIVAVTTRQGKAEVVVDRDETVRATSMEKLAALKPSFQKDGVITAGSSSPLSDGASAIVVASAEAVRDLGLTPRARVWAPPAPASSRT